MNIKVGQRYTKLHASAEAPRGPLIASNSNTETAETTQWEGQIVASGPFEGSTRGEQYSLVCLISIVSALALVAQLVVLSPQFENGLRSVATLLAK